MSISDISPGSIIQKYSFCPPLVVKDKTSFPKGSLAKKLFNVGAQADKYLSFNSREIQIINGKKEEVVVKQGAFKIAVKVMSFVLTLFILPALAFIAKAIYKDYCSKNVKIDPQREVIVPLRETNNPPIVEPKKSEKTSPLLQQPTVTQSPKKDLSKSSIKEEETKAENRTSKTVKKNKEVDNDHVQPFFYADYRDQHLLPEKWRNTFNSNPQAAQKNTNDGSKAPPIKVEKNKELDIPNPEVIFAKDKTNQYTIQSQAACTLFANQFIADFQEADPENLKDLLIKNKRTGGNFVTPEEAFNSVRNKLKIVPQDFYGINVEGFNRLGEDPSTIKENFFNVQIEEKGEALKKFIKFLLLQFKSYKMDGCVISNGYISLAVKIFDDQIEFFDSHGDNTKENKSAYVVRFACTDLTVTADQIFPYLHNKLFNKQTDDNYEKIEEFSVYPLSFKVGDELNN